MKIRNQEVKTILWLCIIVFLNVFYASGGLWEIIEKYGTEPLTKYEWVGLVYITFAVAIHLIGGYFFVVKPAVKIWLSNT